MTNYEISVEGGDSSTSTAKTESKPDTTSILDALKEAVKTAVTLPLIEIDVHARDKVSVVYSPNISSDDLKQWRRKSTNKKTGELNNMKFSATVIVSTCHHILFDGETVLDEDDEPVIMNSGEFADMVQVDMSQIVPEGVRKFFGVDAHLEGTALAILDKAGYGEDIEVEDPT